MTDKKIKGQGKLLLGDTLTVDDANGRLGIGESNPDAPLHLSGNPGFFRLTDTGGGTDDKTAQIQVDSGIFEINTRNDDGSTRVGDAFTIDLGTGNVGIGTASPTTAISGSATVLQISDNNLPGLVLENTGLSRKWTIFQGSTGFLDFRSEFGSNTALSLETTGVVTLGPSGFSGNHTSNGILDIIKTTDSRLRLYEGATQAGQIQAVSSEFRIASVGSYSINFFTNGSVRGSISTGGAWTLGPSSLGVRIKNNGKVQYVRDTQVISAGQITMTSSFMQIDTEGGASTDNLAEILGGETGDIIILHTTNSGRVVTLVHGTGTNDIQIPGGGSLTLNSSGDMVSLIKRGTNWYVLWFQGGY